MVFKTKNLWPIKKTLIIPPKKFAFFTLTDAHKTLIKPLQWFFCQNPLMGVLDNFFPTGTYLGTGTTCVESETCYEKYPQKNKIKLHACICKLAFLLFANYCAVLLLAGLVFLFSANWACFFGCCFHVLFGNWVC